MKVKFEFYKVNSKTIAIDIENMTYSWQRFFKQNFVEDELDGLYYFILEEDIDTFFKKVVDTKKRCTLKEYRYEENKI